MELLAAGRGHSAIFKVDAKAQHRLVFDLLEQLVNFFRLERYRQEANIEGVIVENIGVPGSDNDFEAVLLQSPWGVFAGGATAKILAGQENRGVFVTRLVQ